MSIERTDAIREAAAHRSVDATARARRAVRELSRHGTEVNFAAVAAIANASRQFLHTTPELREDIDKLRGEQRTTVSRTVVEERASDASIRTRLRAALDDNERLREENARLREELVVAHGTVRELQLARRTGRAVR